MGFLRAMCSALGGYCATTNSWRICPANLTTGPWAGPATGGTASELGVTTPVQEAGPSGSETQGIVVVGEKQFYFT